MPEEDVIPGVVNADGLYLLAEVIAATGYDSNIDHRVSEVDGEAYGLLDIGFASIAGLCV